MRHRHPRRKSLPPPPTPLPAGTRVGPWEVRHVLGRGPHAVVYAAIGDDGELEVALKEYLPASLAVRNGPVAVGVRAAADADRFAQGLQRFLDDGHVLSRADHPSLVKVHQVWEEHGTAYMAMDLVAGRTLLVTHQMRARAPREPVLRQMLATLLDAVETLHRAGVRHGDIAPPSIVVEPDGRPVLMDMGSPRWVVGAPDEPTAGPRDGYAAAELYGAAPEGSRAGPWTDLYALGALLHFLIANKPPPPAPARDAGDQIGRRLRQADERFSFEFCGIVEWMLAPAPADRPQDVAQVRAALDGGELPQRHRPTRRMRLGAALRRQRRKLLIALLVLVLLAAAAAVVVVLARSGRLPWLMR